jgi:hypothetical protein
VVRIHAGEPLVLVRTFSPHYLTSTWPGSSIVDAKWRVNAELEVFAESRSRRNWRLKAAAAARMAERLCWRHQASPLFNGFLREKHCG